VAPATKGLDVKDPLPPRGEGGVFSLDIPFYRTRRVHRFVWEIPGKLPKRAA